MTDRPLLFSRPMVRALLDGRKTQTRRKLAKSSLLFNGDTWPKGLDFSDMLLAKAWVDGGPSPAGNPGPYLKADWPYGRLVEGDQSDDAEWLMARLYPKIQTGDRLWVKETHAIVPASAYRMSDGVVQTINPADAHDAAIYKEGWDRSKPNWRPSIFMPKWASRLTLTVIDVRIERLQDISEDDARAEGTQEPSLREIGGDLSQTAWSEKQVYQRLWDAINGPGFWDQNPWVLALTFTVEQRNINQ